jgi:hypothetical protein
MRRVIECNAGVERAHNPAASVKQAIACAFTICCALLLISTSTKGHLPSPTAKQAPSSAAQAINQNQQRFDYLVREDFFAGVAGDQAALDRAMKICEETLAKNPKHAEAMVWHGSGLMLRSGFAFRKGDMRNGADLWDRGLKEMDNAVALAPSHIGVLIARGSTLLGAAAYAFDPRQKKAMLEKGVADYQAVHQQQKPYFDKLSAHSRGELLFGLAAGLDQLGEREKARVYFQLIIDQSQGSGREKQAAAWMETGKLPPTDRMSCTGCHSKK